MVHQDAAHELSRNGKEVRSILPLNLPDIDQPEICLLDQDSRLQRMTRSFAPHPGSGEAMKFVVNDRNQVIQGFAVAAPPGVQQTGDVRPWRDNHTLWVVDYITR